MMLLLPVSDLLFDDKRLVNLSYFTHGVINLSFFLREVERFLNVTRNMTFLTSIEEHKLISFSTFRHHSIVTSFYAIVRVPMRVFANKNKLSEKKPDVTKTSIIYQQVSC